MTGSAVVAADGGAVSELSERLGAVWRVGGECMREVDGGDRGVTGGAAVGLHADSEELDGRARGEGSCKAVLGDRGVRGCGNNEQPGLYWLAASSSAVRLFIPAIE